MPNIISDLLMSLDQRADSVALPTTQEPPPPDPSPKRRGIRPAPHIPHIPPLSHTVEEARAILQSAVEDYMDLPLPDHMLLLAGPPGTGKTQTAVRLAERHAAAGHRVLYLGPSHKFFGDIPQLADHMDWWYEWLPRQEASETKVETCRYTRDMTTWLARGYQAMDFCSNHKVCGWDYVNHDCPYHAQKKIRHPIIFGQHQHITSGHPLMQQCDLIIGDENPLAAFLRHWIIPGQKIVPTGIDPTELLAEILHTMSALATHNARASGPMLLTLLGGAQEVKEACAVFASYPQSAPAIQSPAGSDKIDYSHMEHLVPLLRREADAAVAGDPYPPRIILANGKLHLLLRRHVSPLAPLRMIWLDGTPHQRMYDAMFERPITTVAPFVAVQAPVYQVWSRANGKSTLIQEGEPTEKAAQLTQQVQQIVTSHHYQAPAIVTFKDIEPRFSLPSEHFGNTRGTNRLEGCDALIVAGTPQPAMHDIHTVARMLYFERMVAFDTTWAEQDVPFPGHDWTYPVSGFWQDTDLQDLLTYYREDELVQAIHRARPVLRDTVDIWLLTNVPLAMVPPTKLLTIANIFRAPGKVDAYTWPAVMEVARTYEAEYGCVTTADLVRELGISRPTADKYIKLIAAACGWKVFLATGKKEGRRPKATGKGEKAVTR